MKDEENASSGRLTCKDETPSRTLPHASVYIKRFFHHVLDNKSGVNVLSVIITLSGKKTERSKRSLFHPRYL